MQLTFSIVIMQVPAFVAITQVTVSLAIIQLEVFVAFMRVNVSAANMWVTVSMEIMHAGVFVAIMQDSWKTSEGRSIIANLRFTTLVNILPKLRYVVGRIHIKVGLKIHSAFLFSQ